MQSRIRLMSTQKVDAKIACCKNPILWLNVFHMVALKWCVKAFMLPRDSLDIPGNVFRIFILWLYGKTIMLSNLFRSFLNLKLKCFIIPIHKPPLFLLPFPVSKTRFLKFQIIQWCMIWNFKKRVFDVASLHNLSAKVLTLKWPFKMITMFCRFLHFCLNFECLNEKLFIGKLN